MNHDKDETLAQTENFMIWRSREEDETFYHIELGGLTLHFLGDEWDEFVILMKEASATS